MNDEPVYKPLAKAAPAIPLLFDEEQAAAILSLSQRKLWELAARGAIKSVKIGSLKRYRRTDLEDWVASGCPTQSNVGGK
jgi:excisionase family DNA binding protein